MKPLLHPARIISLLLVFSIITLIPVDGQKKKKDEPASESTISSGLFPGLKWRSIGPAFLSGRIADFAFNPENHSEWYVAVASGHVWKTENNGTTFTPVFDNYGAYAIGCVVIDPCNPDVVWIGTGENNHQRALGYGNGVYKSVDGGKSWKNVGLKDSRQIGMIAINPQNPDIVFVAAEGSVWGPGGERGLFKSTDGGTTWRKVLDISVHTGVNNVIIDPRDPALMYATSEQRRRHVFTKVGGGPESAIYKSTDEGESWRKLTSGLPSGHVGGMGIALSPVNPDIIYAIIEAEGDKSGFYRSCNRGESWEKMSNHASSGQYYNEIYCDPKDVNKVYSVETVTHVTLDGGKTWSRLSLKNRHVDDHAMWIDPSDTRHFYIGGDGGIYETYDNGDNFIFKSNLPVTQFYRVTVDNDRPFYNVYGGTQDNNSFGGPSRNTSRDGVPGSAWYVTCGGDGFWQAVDPTDPNIVYSESQYGNSVRYDRRSGEAIDIRPQPGRGENTYRWNWDAPLILSPHQHTRLYAASERVFRTDDRGNSWTTISGDLTRNMDRNTWKVMDKYWSVDAVMKDVSTSLYGTIVSLAESEVKEGLLYAGTDDGLIQVTGDGGKSWKRCENFPGVPEFTYVSDVCPSKFDENIVFASFNNLLRDDFKPYVMKSTDKGNTWTSISANLPENGSVHCIEQDFVNPDLLFAGTEFSFFFSIDGGKQWIELDNGLPDIQVHDMVIQRRENDLVLATFGRGFYILDDYSPLRLFKPETAGQEAVLFPVRDALMYIETSHEKQGSTEFFGPNPPFGATFTYYLKNEVKTQRELRKEQEKEQFEKGEKIHVLTMEEQRQEAAEEKPHLLFTILDEDNQVVKKLTAGVSKGMHRLTWDLKYESPRPVNVRERYDPLAGGQSGFLAMPGMYKVTLSKVVNGQVTPLAGPVEFRAEALRNTTLPAADREAMVEFQKKAGELARKMQGAMRANTEMINRMEQIIQTLHHTPGASRELLDRAKAVNKQLKDIDFAFNGYEARASSEELPPAPVPLASRLGTLVYTHYGSTADITEAEKEAYDILMDELPPLLEQLKRLQETDIRNIETEMEKISAPWTTGRIPGAN